MPAADTAQPVVRQAVEWHGHEQVEIERAKMMDGDGGGDSCGNGVLKTAGGGGALDGGALDGGGFNIHSALRDKHQAG